MDLRKKELLDLKKFTQSVDTELTMLLQSLQWDRKTLLESTSIATCQYDAHHKMPRDNLEAHESKCVLRNLGYSDTEELLPDPPDNGAHTLVKFSNTEIQHIINEAAKSDPLFKKGAGAGPPPLSLPRLQLLLSADERRALHDAAVAAAPSCHDLGDLALASSNEGAAQGTAAKTRVEILAELRNMKRRRTKYRVAAKSKNYSDVLRDVIRTQMESYTEAVSNTHPANQEENLTHSQNRKVFERNNSRSNTFAQGDNVTSKDKSRTADGRYSSAKPKRHHDAYSEGRRLGEEERRREPSSKKYDDYSNRSDTTDRHYESRRENTIREERKYREETSREKYKSRSEHSSNDGHRHKNRYEEREENGHKSATKNNLDKSNQRQDDYFDRRSESRHKEKYIKIKQEYDDYSRKSSSSKYSHKSDSSRRSRSTDRRREDRKRRHDEEYGSSHTDKRYKRYYDVVVKKEEP